MTKRATFTVAIRSLAASGMGCQMEVVSIRFRRLKRNFLKTFSDFLNFYSNQFFPVWDSQWDVDRKIRYLELHQNEREQRLIEDQALRQRYFQLHREEADAFYRRHAEFASEWNADPLALPNGGRILKILKKYYFKFIYFLYT